jgi:release factor glutamine methyltransferase
MSYQQFWRSLAQTYDEGEAKAIARMVYEVRFGLTLPDLLLGKDTQLSADQQEELQEIVRRLQKQEPVQYILGQAEFCGRTFHVAPGVLIPRPETEELCRWIVKEAKDKTSPQPSPKEREPAVRKHSILDIGTGSGCIAITLAAELPEAQVTAWDISEQALVIARDNARRLNVNVRFDQVDILHYQNTSPSPSSLLALFVPDDDPLLFYRAIATFGQKALKPGGSLYFEINPLCAAELQDLLRMMSYHDIETRCDEYGKQRLMKAIR